MYTDSHCHLAMTQDSDAQLARARAAGVRGFVVPATRLEDAEPALAVARAHPDVWAAVGFHPHEAKDFDTAAETAIRRLARDARTVAIGEIGLDYHYDYSPRDAQRAVLETHLAIAREAGLPVIIHNRESTDDLVAVLESPAGAGVSGVLHSYTESYDVAARLIDRGFYISFSGILTFRTAEALRDVARRLPHDRVLIETDTPYLAPVPHRGKKNEPAFVTEVAATLASLWSVDVAAVARATSTNFERLFGVRIPA